MGCASNVEWHDEQLQCFVGSEGSCIGPTPPTKTQNLAGDGCTIRYDHLATGRTSSYRTTILVCPLLVVENVNAQCRTDSLGGVGQHLDFCKNSCRKVTWSIQLATRLTMTAVQRKSECVPDEFCWHEFIWGDVHHTPHITHHIGGDVQL